MQNIRKLIEKRLNMHQCPERHSQFGRLPIEIKTKIFNHLHFSQKKKLRLVCPNWKDIIDDKMKFNAVLNNTTLPWIENCNYDLESLTVQNLTNSLSRWKMELPHVHEFIIGRGNSSQNVLRFLNHFCQQASSLTLLNLSLSQITPFTLYNGLPKMQWLCLGTLSITMGTKNSLLQNIPQSVHHIEAIVSILKSAHLQTLKVLTMNLDYLDESSCLKGSCKEFQKPFLEVFLFIIKHKNSLRELNLFILGKPAGGERVLTSGLQYEMPKLQLQKFNIKFDGANTPLASNLIPSVNKLLHLKIRETYWTDGYKASIDSKLNMANILRKHGPTVESLETRTISFPFLALDYLKSVKTLDIRTCYPNNIGASGASIIPTLTKFTTYILNEDIPNLDDRLVFNITNRFPNIEKLEIVLLGDIYVFSKEHLESFLKMKKIQKLKIGQHFSSEFLDLCDTLGPEGGVWYLGEEDSILIENMDTYHSIDIQVDPKKIPVVYRQSHTD